VCSSALAQSFTGIGFGAGQTQSIAVDLSMDGGTVVGNSPSGSSARSFVWRPGQGMTTFDYLSAASSVSADGLAFAGGAAFPGSVAAARWVGTNVEQVPNLAGSLPPAPAISGDGATVVGTSDENEHAMRWRADTGTVQLPDCNPESLPVTFAGNPAFAMGVNGDGNVVVGSAFAFVSFPQQNPSIQRVNTPFRWTPSGGTSIIRPGGQVFLGAAYDTSADGNWVILQGNIYPDNNTFGEIYRYNALTNLAEELPAMSTTTAYPYRLSGNGLAAITGTRMWTEGAGTRTIGQVLTDAGCTFTGWTNLVATGIDFGATHLCGYGTNPMGQTEAWYATIPAPGAGAVCAFLALAASRRRR